MARIDLRSTGGSSYGSNATAVSDANAPGVAASSSRSDHRHLGVASITSSSSNTMADPTINLRAGANIGFALDIPSNTLTVSSTASGTVSYASNSNEVGSASDPGASTLLSRADHVHRGVYEVTSSASNTLSQRTVNLRPGANVGFALDIPTNTLTISSTGGGTSVSYASNANSLGTADAGGAATVAARADHVHKGFATVTSSSSNTLTPTTLNLRAGSGIALGLDTASTNQTVTISTLTGGGGSGSGGYAQPTVYQSKGQFQSTSTTCAVTLDATPTRSLLCFIGSTGRGADSITQTNVTWTKIATTNGNSQYAEVWCGTLTGTAGTLVTANFTGSNKEYITVFECGLTFTTAGTVASATSAGATLYQNAFLTTSPGDYVAGIVSANGPTSGQLYSGLPGVPVTTGGGQMNAWFLRSSGGPLALWGTISSSVAYIVAAWVLS